MWLIIHLKCTLDPLNKPKVIVSDKDLKKCRNIPDMAGLVADRLQKDSVTFIKAWITKVREQDNKVRTAGDIEGQWFEFGQFGFSVKRGGMPTKNDLDTDVSDEEEQPICQLAGFRST